MSDCASLTLTVPEAPSLTLNTPDVPTLSFYAASQVPGLALPQVAFENLNGPSFVCITAQGVVMARSFPIRPAHGFVRSAVPSGSSVYVQTDGLCNGWAGLTTGDLCFIASTAGAPTHSAPSSGIAQSIGTAVSADAILVQLDPPVYLA